jgi:hypothetical protein
MLGGAHCPTKTISFQNDMTSIQNRDDVLTLLVHLGYLAYDVGEETVAEAIETVHSAGSALPAMIVELKMNKSADSAINQIKNRIYPQVLEDYGSDILLVGVNYDEKSKEHTCRIERVNRSSK